MKKTFNQFLVVKPKIIIQIRLNNKVNIFKIFSIEIRLNRYKQEGKQFDVVINDLTAIPVDGSDTKEAEDLW